MIKPDAVTLTVTFQVDTVNYARHNLMMQDGVPGSLRWWLKYLLTSSLTLTENPDIQNFTVELQP